MLTPPNSPEELPPVDLWELRHAIGLEQSPLMNGLPNSPVMLTGSVDSSSVATPPATNISRLLFPSQPNGQDDRSWPPSQERLDTLSPPGLQPPMTTSSRRTQESGNHLNSDQDHSSATQPLTGIEFVYWQLPETWNKSRVKFSFDIITPFPGLGPTIVNLLLFNDRSTVSGVQVEQESHTVLGTRLETMRTLKIRAPNFGAAMIINDMLSWMNFEVLLTYPTYFDGWTNILSQWKSKDPPDL